MNIAQAKAIVEYFDAYRHVFANRTRIYTEEYKEALALVEADKARKQAIAIQVRFPKEAEEHLSKIIKPHLRIIAETAYHYTGLLCSVSYKGKFYFITYNRKTFKLSTTWNLSILIIKRDYDVIKAELKK